MHQKTPKHKKAQKHNQTKAQNANKRTKTLSVFVPVISFCKKISLKLTK